MTRPDYCPIGGGPCQSLCVDRCSTIKRTRSHVCPVCAASMIESDEELMRQALEALQFSSEYLETLGQKLFPDSKKVQPGSTTWHVQQAMAALRRRVDAA